MLCFVALALTVRADRADAWEGLCRQADYIRPASPHVTVNRLHQLEQTICSAKAPTDRPNKCEEGLGYARGVQLGEHTWITQEAMQLARLPAGLPSADNLFTAPHGSGLPSGYFTSGLGVALAPGTTSLEPSTTSSMRRWAERRVSIAEVSEVADGSHSFSEYLLGNEHCLPENMPSSTLVDLNECHSFGNKMGSVNATHWPPLHGEMYLRYHQIALHIADRCGRMSHAIAGARAHPLHDDLLDRVKACEREALAFEAYGAHFLEDAWSSGHMFIRWGGPLFPSDVEGQVRAFVAAALTGFIHGTRSLFNEDDAANMPGTVANRRLTPVVHWRNVDGGVFPGGGDLYLRPCTGVDEQAAGAVSTGPLLRPQFAAMLGCTARGFREVYQRTGQVHGTIERTIDPLVSGRAPLDCFGAKLTNASMYESFATPLIWDPLWFDLAPDIGPGDLVRRAEERRAAGAFPGPGILARASISMMLDGDKLLSEADERLGHARFTGNQRVEVAAMVARLPAIRRELSLEAGRVALLIARRNRDAPAATDVATMTGEGASLQRVFGVASTLSWQGELGGVPFLESPPSTWNDRVSSSSCTTDADCRSGQVCDRAYETLSGGTFGGRCVRHEVAILRAFRVAETPYWCSATTSQDLAALQRTCSASADPDRECQPCVEALLPHLRNPLRRFGDQRSICEVFRPGTALATVGASYTDVAGARREARLLCSGEWTIAIGEEEGRYPTFSPGASASVRFTVPPSAAGQATAMLVEVDRRFNLIRVVTTRDLAETEGEFGFRAPDAAGRFAWYLIDRSRVAERPLQPRDTVAFRVGAPSAASLIGTWTGDGYQCNGAEPPERVRIDLMGATLVATKLTGDACVRAGEVTWTGTLQGTRIVGRLQIGEERNGPTGWLDGGLDVVSDRRIDGFGVVYRRD